MGILKSFFSQTRRPEGFLGKLMLSTMNSGHASMADWGLSALPALSPEQVIDLGCGAGRNAGELLKRYPHAVVTALDYSPLSVESAQKYNASQVRAGRCLVVQGDVSDLHLPAAQYDLATAFETIYFWPGLENCFSQVARILKPGGLFLICNESDGTDPAGVKFEKIIDGMSLYTPEKIASALHAAGFSSASIIRYDQKNWIAVLAHK